jgi:hypothetical protein
LFNILDLLRYCDKRDMEKCLWIARYEIESLDDKVKRFERSGLMSMHASILVDSVGPPSTEVCRTTTSFP